MPSYFLPPCSIFCQASFPRMTSRARPIRPPCAGPSLSTTANSGSGRRCVKCSHCRVRVVRAEQVHEFGCRERFVMCRFCEVPVKKGNDPILLSDPPLTCDPPPATSSNAKVASSNCHATPRKPPAPCRRPPAASSTLHAIPRQPPATSVNLQAISSNRRDCAWRAIWRPPCLLGLPQLLRIGAVNVCRHNFRCCLYCRAPSSHVGKAEHEAYCRDKSTHCRFCGLLFLGPGKRDHERTCPCALAMCRYCQRVVHVRHKSTHEQRCPLRLL